MDILPFVKALSHQLTLPLPGLPAQLKMSALARYTEYIANGVPDDAMKSSVLLLLYPYGSEVRLVLMLRPDYGGVHSGQISLPGGKHEDGDESLIYTALREAKEEVGIDPQRVHILGTLTELYIVPSNFIVTPVVAYMPDIPFFIPDKTEVARVIEVPLEVLMADSSIQHSLVRMRNGMELQVPAYVVNGDVIWGATAMILSEFREIVRWIRRSAERSDA